MWDRDDTGSIPSRVTLRIRDLCYMPGTIHLYRKHSFSEKSALLILFLISSSKPNNNSNNKTPFYGVHTFIYKINNKLIRQRWKEMSSAWYPHLYSEVFSQECMSKVFNLQEEDEERSRKRKKRMLVERLSREPSKNTVSSTIIQRPGNTFNLLHFSKNQFSTKWKMWRDQLSVNSKQLFAFDFTELWMPRKHAFFSK